MNSMSEKSQPGAHTSVPTRSGQRALPLPSQFLARLAFWAAVLAMLCGNPAGTFAADPVTKSFTDSQGRTTLYRYSLKDDWNPRQPRGLLVYFHGNNYGTQEDMFGWLPLVEDVAYQHDLVPVVVASPEAQPLGAYDGIYDQRPYQGYGTRIWTDEDEPLIHELLQSQFGGNFSVDFGRIVFWGGSAGSGFLHGFVQSYGENYGGGLLAWCGYGLADPFGQPTQQFRERFRVLVKATTEDFTHGRQTGNYGYYKYTLGLETRGDLEAPGGHCWDGAYPFETAVGWLLDGAGIPEEPVEPHFDRASVFDYVAGLTVDGAGALWVVRQTPAQEDAAIWRSVDRGTNWEAVSRVPLIVADIDAVGDALFLTASTPDRWRSNPDRKQLYRSRDGGLNFTIAGGTDNPRLYYVNEPLVTDRDGKLYVMGSYTEADSPDVYVSDDLGENWTSLGLPQEARYIRITNPDGIWTEQSGLIVVTDVDPAYSAPKAVGKTEGNDWRVLADTPAGPPNSIAWDGSSIWGVAGSFPYSVFQSFDLGSSWLETELPSVPAPFAEATQRFSALNENQQLVFGEGGNAFLRDSGGVWRLLSGGATLGGWSRRASGGTIGKYWDARITLDPSSGDVFASDGNGIFRVDAENRGIVNVEARPDIDRDGVPDTRDAFPSDPSEYLDTDGDGIGNHADSDADGDGVDDSTDGLPFDRFESVDTDSDGVGDGADLDDDGDDVLDVFDDFPLDPQEYADTDGDRIGDRSDADDDGDGINDLADAFPRYPREWLDTDGDGIGDNLDSDDDNDGLADHADPDPLDGPEKPGFLRPADHLSQLFYVFGSRDDRVILPVHQERQSQIIYPDDLGDAPSFGYIRLGDKSSFEIQFAVDEFAWRGNNNSLAKVYFDRNGNGDLTDDGPPSVISIGAVNAPGIRIWPLEIPYASGEVVPYGISIDGANLGYGGSTTAGARISSVILNYGGSWVGEVPAPNGSMTLVQTVDYDIDGVFNRSPEDFVCIDVDGDRGLDCGPDGAERFRHEDPFTLDGQQLRVRVAASGHHVELVLADSPGPTPPGTGTVGTESFSIPDRGGQSTTSSGTAETLRVGYGRIRADAGSTTPSGAAIFQFRDSLGVLISEAGVPAATPVRAGRIFAEVNGPVNTGLAIANPNDVPATIRFYFTDANGTRFADGRFELGANQQTAKFLDQPPFNGGPSVLGTLTFTSSLPVAVVALRGLTNEAGEFLMTTLPVAPLSPPSSDTVYFPHFADGGGWTTQVILVNPTDGTIAGTVGFLGPGSDTEAVAPVVLGLEDGSTGSHFDYSIPPSSAQRFTTSNPTGRLAVGSVRATPSSGNAAPSGLVVFSYAQDGKTVSEAGVPALPKGTAFRAYVEASGTPEQAGSIRSGLAITNTADTSNTVTLEVTRLDGSLAVAPATLVLPPLGHVARFLDQIFSLTDTFSGILRVTSTADVAIVALRLRVNENDELKVTTTSPSNEMDPSTSEDRFFAHLADSGGWSTQFILFSGTAGQTASGALSFIDASGQPLDLTTHSDPEMLAPANEAAFNALVVGKRAAKNYPEIYVDFVSPGRFRETEGGETWAGNYTYRNTGSHTGTLTFNYDDGDLCTSSLMFVSTTAATSTYTCNDGSNGEYNWHLVGDAITGTITGVSLEISGMDDLTSIGETIQLSVTANVSDGSRQAVGNALLQWQSSDLAVVTVLEGTVTAVGGGNATITAIYDEERTVDVAISVHISVHETSTVRVLYAAPMDRVFRSDYRQAIQHAIVDLQSWYRQELKGLTFSLYDATPEQCQLSEAADFYGRYSWQKVVDGVQHCAPVEEGTSTFTWVVYVDVEVECAPDGSEGDWEQGYAQLGRGGPGLTILPRDDMDGLIGEKIVYYGKCGGGPWDGPVERWIGGLGHELGHTFGLPHPQGCDEELPTCDYDALMANGYEAYPDTYLRPDEKATLRSSPFIGRN